jgi:hypothetical protein
VWAAERTRCGHDGLRRYLALGGLDVKAMPSGEQINGQHINTSSDRRIDHLGIVLAIERNDFLVWNGSMCSLSH